MRIAVMGAAAAALLGGTLALTPLSSVGTPTQRGETCDSGTTGEHCQRLASALMPGYPASAELPAPAAAPAAATAPAAPAPAEPAPAAPAFALPSALSGGSGYQPSTPLAAVPNSGVANPVTPGTSGVPNILQPWSPGSSGIPGLTDEAVAQATQSANLLASSYTTASVVPSVVNGVVGIGSVIGSAGVGLLYTLAALNGVGGNGGFGNIVGVAQLLAPTVLPVLDSAGSALQAGIAQAPAIIASLPGLGLPGLPNLGALIGALPPLPGLGLPGLAGLPNAEAILATLQSLPAPNAQAMLSALQTLPLGGPNAQVALAALQAIPGIPHSAPELVAAMSAVQNMPGVPHSPQELMGALAQLPPPPPPPPAPCFPQFNIWIGCHW
jgi:hypothetical protein